MNNKIQKPCYVCGHSIQNKHYQVNEMMFGTKESFCYQECSQCGVLELMDIPKSLEKYYPETYYSFSKPSYLKLLLKMIRGSRSFGKKSFVGAMLEKKWGPSPLKEWFDVAQVKHSDRIMDIGCGYGSFISELAFTKYKSVVGVDPYLKKDIRYRHVKVERKEIKDLKDNTADFIMLHHSFEHMENPRQILEHFNRILSPRGQLLLRIPILGYAWETYRENWVNLDAPRHLFLHSVDSLENLVDQAGFKIVNSVYDSSDFQIWGSIQYEKGINLESKNSYVNGIKNSIFTQNEIDQYKQLANELNKNKSGDTAGFLLRKK